MLNKDNCVLIKVPNTAYSMLFYIIGYYGLTKFEINSDNQDYASLSKHLNKPSLEIWVDKDQGNRFLYDLFGNSDKYEITDEIIKKIKKRFNILK